MGLLSERQIVTVFRPGSFAFLLVQVIARLRVRGARSRSPAPLALRCRCHLPLSCSAIHGTAD
jgi:hypothetical protein